MNPLVGRAQESLWLLAVFLVPLVVVTPGFMIGDSIYSYAHIPKITLLRTVAAAIVVLWTLEWVVLAGNARLSNFQIAPRRALSWLKAEPTRWVAAPVGALVLVTVISAILSPVPRYSLLGETESFGGYPVYTVLSYVVISMLIATHLNSQAQALRLIRVVAACGFLVGLTAIFQHYDVAPFDFLRVTLPEHTGTGRAAATLGNPIYSGAVLVLTVPVTLLAGLLATRRMWDPLPTGIWTIILAVQVLGLIFMLSRGAWVGLAVALVAFFSLSLFALGRAQAVRAAILIGPAVGISLIVLYSPFPRVGGGEEIPGDYSREVAERVVSIRSEVGGGGVSGRLEPWKDSMRLIFSRPWFEYEELSHRSLRPFIGYGPDLFRYVFLLESRPLAEGRIPRATGHAHNMLIQQTVELGYLGTACWLGLFSALFVTGFYRLVRHRAEMLTVYAWILIALLSIMAGRFMEQMVGVSRVGDLTLFWALVGLFIALPAITRQPVVNEDTSNATPLSGRGMSGRSFKLAAVALAVAVSLGALWLTWTKNLNYAVAAVHMGDAEQALRDGNGDSARQHVSRASYRAPNMSLYHVFESDLRYRESVDAGSAEAKRFWVEQAYLSGREAVRTERFSYQAHQAVARSALALATLEFQGQYIGQPEKGEEALRLYRETTQMVPMSWPLYNDRALAHLRLKQPAEALPLLDQSLLLSGQTPYAAAAWYYKGLAYQMLRRQDDAIIALEESIRLGGSSPYSNLARRLLDAMPSRGN